MTLTSFDYLIFLPFVFLVYWGCCGRSAKWQNAFLLLANLVFYACWDWRFLSLLLVTAASTFLVGKLMDREENCRRRFFLSLTALVLNIGVLACFKYFNFFVQSFADLFALFGITLQLPTLKILLPVGISFYTFAALSYTLDVYMRKIKATDDWLAYFSYVTFFPSILSGPIGRATVQLPQFFRKRVFGYDWAVRACRTILYGAFMKLCVADRLGLYVDAVYGNISQHNGTSLFLASVFYTLQIYADFAGYSLMAIGSGKLFGIDLQTNFVRPYFSKTVTEFWRRWHISLTTWFRDYIYFPLGGSRVSKKRWMLNIMVVFTVSGIWHGAAYTFVLWGMLHGACMVVERLLYGSRIKDISNRLTALNLVRIFFTFNIVSLAWILFRLPSLSEVGMVVSKIFTEPGMTFLDNDTMLLAAMSLVIMLAKDIADEWLPTMRLMNNSRMVVRFVSCLFLLCYILLFGVLNGGSFIYFQF